MHCNILDNDKEFSTAKGANVATDFSEFKDILFNKKWTRHKMKRIQSYKKHKIGTNKVNKYDYCVLMIMIFVLDYGVHTFASFYNNLRK